MKYLKRFVLMMQFLTTIPIRINLNVTNEDFGKGLVFAPLVGALIGGLLGGAMYLLRVVFPVRLSSVIVIILYMMLTGGLHLDGLADTFDGLFSNRPKEKILEIMRDSRIGTNGVLAIVGVLFLNIALLESINDKLSLESAIKAIMLMPVAGRIGSLIGAGSSVYARSEGLGKSFIDFCGLKEIIIGSVLYIAYVFLLGGWQYIIPGLIPILASWLLVKFFSRKIGGATGDILGAVCELNQVVFLFAALFSMTYLST
jgi:adenosylcobinamide-GDP ribazoletransferase